MDISVVLAFLCGTDFQKEFCIGKLHPSVIRLKVIEHYSITMNRILVQIADKEIFEDQCILRCVRLVTKHRLDFFFGTVIIAFVVSAESTSKHILPNKDGLFPALGTRHFDHNEIHSVVLNVINVVFQKNVAADFLTVI